MTDDNEKGVMITSASYATPARNSAEPEYRELEPEYDLPSTGTIKRQPSSPEKPYHVPEKNADIAPRSRFHESGTSSSSLPLKKVAGDDSNEEFYYDEPADSITTQQNTDQ